MRSFCLVCVLIGSTWSACRAEDEPLFRETLDVSVPHVSTDSSIKLDYDIVYVRADAPGTRFTSGSTPTSRNRSRWNPVPT